MSKTSIRRASEIAVSGQASPLRRGATIFLIAVCIATAVWLFNRDTEWESRSLEAKVAGQTAEDNGNHEEARRCYEAALANNPYDWKTHLALANLINYRLNDPDAALQHYLYALTYCPVPDSLSEANAQVAILRRIRKGELENPYDALEDMFLSVEATAENAFRRRLSPRLTDDADAFWNAWRARGRGKVTFCAIASERNGFFDANLELDFPDNTVMSMHLYCPSNDIWRLELSFP